MSQVNLSLDYQGLTIEVRWSSANHSFVVEVFEEGNVLITRYRNVYEELSDDEFLAMVKKQVDTYLNGSVLLHKTQVTFNAANK